MAMIGELTATPLDGKARASFEANYLVVDNAGMVFETKKGNFIALRDIHLTVAKGDLRGRDGNETQPLIDIDIPSLNLAEYHIFRIEWDASGSMRKM